MTTLLEIERGIGSEIFAGELSMGLCPAGFAWIPFLLECSVTT